VGGLQGYLHTEDGTYWSPSGKHQEGRHTKNEKEHCRFGGVFISLFYLVLIKTRVKNTRQVPERTKKFGFMGAAPT
jgi:hypothetical protein